MNPAARILRTLAAHLEGPAHVRLMGGAALILGYDLQRNTEDVDLLLDDREIDLLIERSNIGAALDATNRDLESEGLYITHIWGPEQQILSPIWRESCRALSGDWGTPHLTVSSLGPIDLILSKLCRADDGDLDDMRYLIATQHLELATLEHAISTALVPDVFKDIFPENAERLRALYP